MLKLAILQTSQFVYMLQATEKKQRARIMIKVATGVFVSALCLYKRNADSKIPVASFIMS